jgi:tetraacyldisaccharide 4'-kinase
VRLRSSGDGADAELAELAGREVDLVSGIGNPEGFEATLRALGASVVEHRRFPDHHPYERRDLEGLGADGRWVVTTGKDAVKLAPLGLEARVLDVELELTGGAPVVAALLDALPESRATRERNALHEGLHG